MRTRDASLAARNRIGDMIASDRVSWLLALVALVIGLVLLAVDLEWNHGHLIAGQDDVYILLQYAKTTATGHFFAIYPGYGVTSGVSTVLYALWLSLGYLVGFHGTALTWFALVTGIACWAVTTALVCQLGTILVARSVGIWAGILVALSGSIAWSATSGMEVAVAMMLVMGTLRVMVAETPSGRYRWTPVVAGLLALTRPEGLLFAGALCCAQWWYVWERRMELGRVRAIRYMAWILLPVVLFAAELLFYRLTTGSLTSDTYEAKSLFYTGPVFFFWSVVDQVFGNVQTIVATYTGLTTQLYVFPGATLVFVVGMAFLFIRRSAWRILWTAISVGLIAVVLMVSTLLYPAVQYMRYMEPFAPLFLLVVVAGLYALTRVIADNELRRHAMYGAGGIALVFALIALPTWLMRFGRDTADLRGTDVRAANWVQDSLPKGTIVAVKDLGAVAYYGDHPVVDLIGLGTKGFALPNNNGPGSLYEHLIHMPVDRRPAYVVDYNGGDSPADPFVAVGMLANPPVATLPVEVQTGVSGPLNTPFTSLVVDKFDWGVAKLSGGSAAQGHLRDHLVVGYLKSEADHAYLVLPAETGVQPMTVLARNGNEIDSGRTVIGGEAFTVKHLTPHAPLIITAHWFVEPESATKLDVNVAGRLATTVPLTPTPPGTAWTTVVIRVPARFVSGRQVRLELKAPPGAMLLNPYPSYLSYGYWFSQP